MLGLCSVLENPGPTCPAPREGSGAKGPVGIAIILLLTMAFTRYSDTAEAQDGQKRSGMMRARSPN